MMPLVHRTLVWPMEELSTTLEAAPNVSLGDGVTTRSHPMGHPRNRKVGRRHFDEVQNSHAPSCSPAAYPGQVRPRRQRGLQRERLHNASLILARPRDTLNESVSGHLDKLGRSRILRPLRALIRLRFALLAVGCVGLLAAAWAVRREHQVPADARLITSASAAIAIPSELKAPELKAPELKAPELEAPAGKRVRCQDGLAEPLPACVLLNDAAEPLLRPQIDASGTLQLVLPAQGFAAAEEFLKRFGGQPRGDEFVVLEVSPESERIVYAGRCPGDDAYLASFTRDDHGTLQLLCLEYDSAARAALPSDACLDDESCCSGPLAWHGVVTGPTTARFRQTRRLEDRCKSKLQADVVLALAGTTPMVAYCATVFDGSCAWRLAVLSDGTRIHSLRAGSRAPVEREPREFYVQNESLFVVVSVPDPTEKFESVYELWSLDARGALRRQPLPLAPTAAAPSAHPREGYGRSPRPMTTFTSGAHQRLTTALRLAPLDALPAASDPMESALSVDGATAPAGLRTFGDGVVVLPSDDGETHSLRIDFPGGGSLSLEGRTVAWVRASCRDACITTFQLLPDARSETEDYPGGLYVLRTPRKATPESLGDVGTDVRCRSLSNGELSCEEKR